MKETMVKKVIFFNFLEGKEKNEKNYPTSRTKIFAATLQSRDEEVVLNI